MAWLVEEDLRGFARDGHLVVPGVVPEPSLASADLEVDGLLAEVAPAEGTGGPGANLWFPSCARLPSCDRVLRASPALGIAEELVAPYVLDHAFDHIQVATTVPPYHHVPGGPHIDGHRPGPEAPASFTLLAGVFLTDQRASRSGNLWVWPGSHLDHQRLFLDRGTDAPKVTSGHAALLHPPVRLSAPVEVKSGRGDLLIAHFLLGHNKGADAGPQVRRTIYYRLAVPGHAERWASTFLDPWTEYAPVRRALAARGRSRGHERDR